MATSKLQRNKCFLFSTMFALLFLSLWLSLTSMDVMQYMEGGIYETPEVVSVQVQVLAVQNITVTVMVDLREWRDWGFSFLEAHQLQLYGRYNYKVEWFHFMEETEKLQRLANSSEVCLLVSNPKGLEEIRRQYAPNCLTWLINDEYCKHQGDIRHYFKYNSTEIFLPLGPRYDFDHAFRNRPITKNFLPTSQRPYRFNAIFSKSTSPSRKLLKEKLLQSPQYNNTTDYFIRIPGRWRRQMHPSINVNSSHYVQILSQSQFTLSPTGHNPECFRFYESILMGSIPIIIIGDDEYQSHRCPNALQPLLQSVLQFQGLTNPQQQQQQQQQVIHNFTELQEHVPFVILQSWTQLETTLERILGQGPEALDARQRQLGAWYTHFMQQSVWNLEEFLWKQ